MLFLIHTQVDWEFEQKLPKDNENIMKMIEHRESEEITKKDLIFSSGIRLNNGKVVIKSLYNVVFHIFIIHNYI